jgi:hypothetical protein
LLGCPDRDLRCTAPQDHDQLQLLLGICEDFFRYTSPATRAEVDALLRRRGITGGPGWLVDMLGLTRLNLQNGEYDNTPKADRLHGS